MNFFRLRFINTLLLLLIGIVLGYIMKERAGNKAAAPYTASRAAALSPGGPEKPGATQGVQDQEGVLTYMPPGAQSAPRPAKPKPVKPEKRETRTPPTPAAENVYQEKVPAPAAKEPAKDKAGDAVRGAEDSFFKDPGSLTGQELEMNLQMIMARKTPKGWLINMVRSKDGKTAEYIYIEDESVLGEKPDLRIGYFYKTRFLCVKGATTFGNKLISLTPTNDKASWATGVSAIE